MISRRNCLPGVMLVFGLVSFGFAGCSSSPGDNPGAGGSPGTGGANATGGTKGTGGSQGTGGSVGSGGSVGTGGTPGTGGSVGTGGSASGGTKAAGGSSPGGATGGGASGSTVPGTGGVSAGGAGGKTTGPGGTTGGTSGGGTTGTSTSSGDCKKGQVKGSEVIFMGESFYAMPPTYIQKRVESNAKTAGALGANETYRNYAISGQPLNNVIPGEFDTALKSGAVKVVIMDGGGIDCMSSPCDACPGIFKTLLTKMASNGVQEVIYTRYPEPGNPPGSNTSLKGNLDKLMPKMEPVCKEATGLRCHWVDLRPVWVNGDTSDGLHPTESGGKHVGDAIWAEMVKDCIAQ